MSFNFKSTSGEWMGGQGAESDIVISSRIRLARNIKLYNFMCRLDLSQRSELETYVKDSLNKAAFKKSINYHSLRDANAIDLEQLVERHLISRDLATAEGARGVAIGDQEIVSIMVNEEDHIRIQALLSGLQLDRLWNIIDEVDDQLDAVMPYAFHPQFGYLTACPTNVGTGMRVSVMLHLPGLSMTGQIEKVFYAVSKISLAVRGLYGEGSRASSDFYQISNQVTLGKTEEQLIDNLKSVIPQIIKYEREARVKLWDEDRVSLEDKIWRAFGTMQHARQLTQEECFDHLSTLRLGVNLDLLNQVPIARLNELFVHSLPAHLKQNANRDLTVSEINIERARLVRNAFDDFSG